MGFISREQFLKQQAEKDERREAFNNGPHVGYFSLKNDGDEAVVRFCYSNPDEFDIVTTHQINADGKFRRVNCLRESLNSSVDSCPLCKAGNPVQNRFYIKMIEYVRNDNGEIEAKARIWERPASYVQVMSNLFTEYGDIAECVFKVKRSGKAGDLKTTYSIMLANPTVYNASLYPKVDNAFEGYNIIGNAVLDKNFDELAEMSGTEPKPSEAANQAVTTSAPRKVTY